MKDDCLGWSCGTEGQLFCKFWLHLMHQTMFPYQSGHSISIVDTWGFQGVHLSRNRYCNRVTEGSDWDGANPEDFGLLMTIGPKLSSATRVWLKWETIYRVYVWKRIFTAKKTIQSNHVSKLWDGGTLPGTVSERFLLRTAISMQRNTRIHSWRICGQLLRDIFLRVAKYFKMMGHRCIRLTPSRLGKEITELTPPPPLQPRS